MKTSQINIGDVFRATMNKANGIFPKSGNTSRDKYFVVLGFDKEGNIYGGVIFNSYINMNLPPNVQSMQVSVSKGSYDFLSHDSYIDCSSIKIMKKNKLAKSPYLGSLSSDDISKVKEKISINSKISKIERKRFGL